MFNSNIQNTHHFIKNKMMLKQNEIWNLDGDYGIGDALWRTSVAYIAYKNSMLKEGILQCFRKFTMINYKNKHWYQASRAYNRYREDDVSRDQIILALAALKINGDDTEVTEIGNNLPVKLSRRFRMGLGMRLWVKAISTNKSKWHYAFQFIEIIELFANAVWNKVIRRLLSQHKEYKQDWYIDVDYSIGWWNQNDEWIVNDNAYWVNNGHRLLSRHQHRKDTNKVYWLLDRIQYPEYALFLTAWLVYTSKNSCLKKILQKLGRWIAEDDNLLMRKLFGKEISNKDLQKYKPMNNFRWSTRLNGTMMFRLLKDDDSLFNTLDKDILQFDQIIK